MRVFLFLPASRAKAAPLASAARDAASAFSEWGMELWVVATSDAALFERLGLGPLLLTDPSEHLRRALGGSSGEASAVAQNGQRLVRLELESMDRVLAQAAALLSGA